MIFRLAFKNMLRHPLRTLLTILGMAIAVTAFSVIRSAIDAWYLSAEAASPDRLITRNSVSLVFELPMSYIERVDKVPGTKIVSHASWFGGIYVDPANFFPKFAVDPAPYFAMYPEYVLPADQMAQFVAERNAAVVGRQLADRFGWKLGDQIRIVGDIYPGDWDFVIRGIYTGARDNTDEATMFFQYEYLDERLRAEMPSRAGQIGTLVVQIDDPKQAATTSEQIDALFKNSLAETKTETEEAFTLGFVSMSSSIIAGLRIVSILVIGIILLVLGNTMVMTARERINEYAVLKTLGYRRHHIAGLIVTESLLIAVLGGLLGIVLSLLIVPLLGMALSNFLPKVPLESLTLILASIAAVTVGLLAAIFPTLKAIHTPIVEGLRVID